MLGLAASTLAVSSCAERSGGLDRQIYGIGDWRLAISRDRFSNETSCLLHTHDRNIRFDGNALGFTVGKSADVLRSWYRIDEGPARRWRNDLPELARLKVSIDGREMAQPTSGIVWIPLASLEQASRVAVQAQPGKKARNFSLNGFKPLYTYAVAHGCNPANRFLP